MERAYWMLCFGRVRSKGTASVPKIFTFISIDFAFSVPLRRQWGRGLEMQAYSRRFTTLLGRSFALRVEYLSIEYTQKNLVEKQA